MGNKLLIAAVVALLFACGKKDKEAPAESGDAVSSATQKKQEWTPIKDSIYEVAGYKKGLKGCLIKYNNSLYRGGNILSAEGAKLLKQKGIRTVVSVTPDENISTLCKSFSFDEANLFYDYGVLPDSTINRFLDVLDSAEFPLYIHCFSGNQRAGLLCAVSRIYLEGWSFEKAENEYGKLGGKVTADHPLLVRADEIVRERLGKSAVKTKP